MEEKKLTDEVVVAKNAITDEEIAKAILQQIEYNAGIPYIDEWLKVKTIKFTDILNFIHRLQAENEELKSPKFASWKLKFFNLKEEFDKELAEHEEFAEKAKAEIERLTKKAEEATFWKNEYLEWATGFLKTRFDIKDWFVNPETQKTPCTYEFFASTLWEKIRPAMEWLDELKDRNEKLHRENIDLIDERENMQAVIFGLEEDKRLLQNQVDELKTENTELYKEHTKLIAGSILQKKQAVRDTAKEILNDLRNIFIEQSSYGCDANQHIGYYDYVVKIGLVIEQVEEYAKLKYGIEYGVEVE